MESVEISARTVDEAIEIALSKLGLDRSQVEVEVLQKERGGIFGFGSEEAKVRVTPLPKPAQEDIAALAKEVTEKLLFLMKVPATVQLKEEESVEIPPSVSLDITGDDLGILIGRRGQTLTTLQYMVSLIISRRLKSGVRVMLDIAGYKQRRQQELRNLALRVAELVKSSKRSITLEPMSPAERRIIHLTLRDDSEVMTQGIGEGENRKVLILLRRRGSRGAQ